MLRPLVRARIVALLIVLSIVPSSMELIEVAVHWIEHGDLAHGDQDGHDTSALGTDEHGCSGTFHLCGCHTASVLAPSIATVVHGFDAIDTRMCFTPVTRAGLGAMAPPIRPPIG
jgi:hypothetical protein